ncbi:hypothetical protein ABL78_7949 [Leptomonas seymouri]|uniref:Uncharacterized protein n=1 Tax=Leptomonas seymouri TaxID=5684 RepID=A0A0N1HZU1_LEPSE|nr:hypothetical protein ABL78_7949 [Leptomonas seymouri]|eukprot:KPI83031.1 hypothetical protein ABL78_7949 [Leptomonas seymouri]
MAARTAMDETVNKVGSKGDDATTNRKRLSSSTSSPPFSPEGSITEASESVRRQWCRLLPPPWMSRDAAPARTETSRQQHQTSPQPTTREAASFTASSTDPAYCRHEEQQRQLWFLLTHYPLDASGCLSMSFSLCHILGTMRQSPPPAISSSNFRKYIGATESAAAGHALRPGVVPAGAASSGTTCPCGCLVRGRYLDPALYSFHINYYYFHLPLGQRDNSVGVAPHGTGHVLAGGESTRSGDVRGHLHPTEHGSTAWTSRCLQAGTESRLPHPPLPVAAAAAKPSLPPDMQRQLHVARQLLLPTRSQPSPAVLPAQQQQQCQASQAPSLASLQMSLQVELVPLLAIQTLAAFVWRSSERECSFRQRRRARAARRSHGSKDGEGQRLAGSPTPAGERLGLLNPPHSTAPACCSVSPSRSAPTAGADAFEEAYRSFCDERNRTWAVMASVRLAWSHLQQQRSTALFIPHLEVLDVSQHDQRRQDRPLSSPSRSCRRVSELERAAAAIKMSTEAFANELIGLLAPPGGTAPSCAYVDAFHRVRVRLLAQVDDRCSLPSQRKRGEADRASSSSPSSPLLVNVTQELLRMEAYVSMELGGCTAQMPLWCQVALEVLLLFTESRRRDRALHRCALGSGLDSMLLCETMWERVYCHGVRLLVRLMVRLLLLPTLHAGARAELRAASAVHGSKSRRSTSPPPPAAGKRRCAERAADDVLPVPRAAVPAGSSQSSNRTSVAASAAAVSPTLSEDVVAMSQHMLHHPLFGIAVVVVGGLVPLSWAATCVTGASLPTPSSRGCTARTASSARAMEVWRELTRLVDDIQRWLRWAEGRRQDLT